MSPASKMRMALLMEESWSLLRSFQPEVALKRLEEIVALTGSEPGSEFCLLCVWAQLMTLSDLDDLNNTLANIGDQLNKIAPRDRNNALYYFVKGLFEKRRGHLTDARANFARAMTLDSDFIEAERELRVLDLKSRTM